MDEQVTWDSHIERAQEGAPEQISPVAGIGPTLDVTHTGTVSQLSYEESLVYLPSLSSDNSGKREHGVARNGVEGGLAIVGRSRG